MAYHLRSTGSCLKRQKHHNLPVNFTACYANLRFCAWCELRSLKCVVEKLNDIDLPMLPILYDALY